MASPARAILHCSAEIEKSFNVRTFDLTSLFQTNCAISVEKSRWKPSAPTGKNGAELTKARRKIDAALKAKIALEALREQATVKEPAQRRQAPPTQIYAWKKQLVAHAGGASIPLNREGTGGHFPTDWPPNAEPRHQLAG